MNKIKSSEIIFSIFSPSLLEKNQEGKKIKIFAAGEKMNLVQNIIHPW